MSTARNIINFENGETLTPTKLNLGFERLYRDLSASAAKRFYHGSFELDFSGITNTTDSKDLSIVLDVPFIFDITGFEVVLYTAAATISSVTVGVEGYPTSNLTVAALGAATRARETKDFNISLNGNCAFTISVNSLSSPWTVDRCYVIVHYKTDSGSGTYVSKSLIDSPRFASYEDVVASKVNTGFTDYETEVTNNVKSSKRIHVFTLRNIASALSVADRDLRIPGTAKNLYRLQITQAGDTGNNLTADILNSAGGSVATATAIGSTGVKVTSLTTPNVAQTTDDAVDPTDDYKLRFSRSGASVIGCGYIVVYSL